MTKSISPLSRALFFYALFALISTLASCAGDKLTNLENQAKEIEERHNGQLNQLTKAQKQAHAAEEKVKASKNAREEAEAKYNEAKKKYEKALKQAEQDKQKALLNAQTQAQQDKQTALAQAQAQAQQALQNALLNAQTQAQHDKQTALAQAQAQALQDKQNALLNAQTQAQHDKQTALAKAQAQALQDKQNALAQAQAQALQDQQKALAQAQAQALQDQQKAQEEADRKLEILKQLLEEAERERIKALEQEKEAELHKKEAHEKVEELREMTEKSNQERIDIQAQQEAKRLARSKQRAVKSLLPNPGFGFTPEQVLCQRGLFLLKSKEILDEDKASTIQGADGQSFSLPRLDQLVALAGGKDDNHCNPLATSPASQDLRKNIQATLAKCFKFNPTWEDQDEKHFELLVRAVDREKEKHVVCKGSIAGISYDNQEQRTKIKDFIIPSLRSAFNLAFKKKITSSSLFQSGIMRPTDDKPQQEYDFLEAHIERSLDIVINAKDLADKSFIKDDIIFRISELNKPIGMPKIVRILSCGALAPNWPADNGLADYFRLLGSTKQSNVSVFFGALDASDKICTKLNQSLWPFLYDIDDNPTNINDIAWRELHAARSLSCISFLSGSPFQSRLCAPLLKDLNLAGGHTEVIQNHIKQKKPALGNIGTKIMAALKHIDPHGYTEGKLYALSYNEPLEAYNSPHGAGVLQTPDIRVWDIAKAEDESKKALTEVVEEKSCPGGFNDVFKLCRCKILDTDKDAGCYPGTQCQKVGAAGEALCTRPQDTFWMRIYDEMIKAQYFIDFSSLDMASKKSHTREAILSAMEYLAKEGRSVLVRMIFGDNSGQLQGTQKLSEEIIERTKKYPRSKLRVYVSSICARDADHRESSFGIIPKFAAWTTWAFDLVPGESEGVSPCQVSGLNHSKIIVIDGTRLTKGGINLYEAITNTNPVFDLALNIKGVAALYASRFLDVLWSKSCQSNLLKNVFSNSSRGFARALQCPPQARDYLMPIWRGNENGAKSPQATMPVITVGRLGAAEAGKHKKSYFHDQVGEGTHVNPSDAATIAMLKHATKSIKIAQQSLHQTPPARVLHKVSENIKWGGLPANEKYIATLCQTLLNSKDDIRVEIIISNEAALVNGTGAYYSASKLDTFNAIFSRCMALTKYKTSQKKLGRRICDNVHVMSVGFAQKELWKPGHPQWTGHGDNQQIANHSKVVIVDDEAAYVGSHNLYPMELQEAGSIILGENNVRPIIKEWWENMRDNAVVYNPKEANNPYCN